MRAGAPARITFTQTSDQTCATAVVFAALNIRREVPLNMPVTIEFTPDKVGEIAKRPWTAGNDGTHGEPGAHDRHKGHSVAMFRDRFWITLLLSIPTLLWSGMAQHMVGVSAPAFPGSL